ncbi:hypothetical protein BKA58DRAFT_406390 [Alternaria rosae]|uniref:uncharacterized protein n=1 Tax=Alternaria rosae TaxID=1187941 RepID=UPI001E8D04B2|nr:uncharacterized protein BKA58DRAFT_406390 [Alternaria rosae]KAH6852984.1 hypothetical protein BKA58DRAFT_406390 [Alternaria rosae]
MAHLLQHISNRKPLLTQSQRPGASIHPGRAELRSFFTSLSLLPAHGTNLGAGLISPSQAQACCMPQVLDSRTSASFQAVTVSRQIPACGAVVQLTKTVGSAPPSPTAACNRNHTAAAAATTKCRISRNSPLQRTEPSGWFERTSTSTIYHTPTAEPASSTDDFDFDFDFDTRRTWRACPPPRSNVRAVSDTSGNPLLDIALLPTARAPTSIWLQNCVPLIQNVGTIMHNRGVIRS